MLGALQQQLDGMSEQSTVVIGATNRGPDLDPALLSRFDSTTTFGLPSGLSAPRQACCADSSAFLIESIHDVL